jgi:hypothetical protein
MVATRADAASVPDIKLSIYDAKVYRSQNQVDEDREQFSPSRHP